MSTLKLILAALAAVAAGSAKAAPIYYIGADNGVSSLAQMVNSSAAAASFDAAVSGATVINFEGALPAGVGVAGGFTTNSSGCGALCGFNITSGGSFFRLLSGGSTTFTFTNAIDAFGFFITGLQTNLVPQQTVTYFDGSTQSFNFPAAINGGGAFIGFTDIGKQIVSVTINATNDIVAVDDVRFGVSSVPEPGTLALMGLAALGFGASRRRR